MSQISCSCLICNFGYLIVLLMKSFKTIKGFIIYFFHCPKYLTLVVCFSDSYTRWLFFYDFRVPGMCTIQRNIEYFDN